MTNENPTLNTTPQKWYQGLTRYHWWVLCIACMAWLFDTMDQRIFG